MLLREMLKVVGKSMLVEVIDESTGEVLMNTSKKGLYRAPGILVSDVLDIELHHVEFNNDVLTVYA